MPERNLSSTTYIVICVLLILLTLLTVGVSFLRLPGVWHVVLGLIIATCKATLVVLFFMHVLISDRLTRIVIVVVIFWFVLLMVGTFVDFAFREMIPFMPGH
jgi:cytochrome c oxidase subunit 4